MITKFEHINNFGCFQNFNWDVASLSEFKKVNLIYGYNGSGKTTLSNLFYLFSTGCKNKIELVDEYLTKDTSFKISTKNGDFSEKSYEKFDEVMYVFNSKFINDHIFDGSKSNMSAFGTGSKISNEIIDEIDLNINVFAKRFNMLVSLEKRLTEKLNTIWEIQKKEFNNKISGKRLTDSPKITDEIREKYEDNKQILNKLYIDIAKFENAEILNGNIGLIKTKIRDLIKIEIDTDKFYDVLFVRINNDLNPNIKTNVDKIISNLAKSNINGNNWLISGNELLKENKKNDDFSCPLCKSNIKDIIEDLITQYDNYFNEALKNLFVKLEEYENQIKEIFGNVVINIKLLDEINVYLKQFKYHLVNKFECDEKILRNQIKGILNLIIEKRKKPYSNITLEKTLFSEIDKINKKLSLNIDELNEFILSQEKDIKILLSRDIPNEIKIAVKKLTISEFNLEQNCCIKNSKKSNAQIASKIQILKKKNESLTKDLYLKREIEVAKLELETKYVNIYLEYLGVSEFIIQRVKDKENDNISISYKTGTKKYSLKYSLSEGEKTALAFAFFLSKIRAEQIEGKDDTFDKVLIVVDDPISSLDDNRLYHTANLIDSFFHYNELANGKIPMQTFILSHNITFLKYISNIFYANTEIQDYISEYYIEPITHNITKVPNSLKNFTTTYLEKLDEIISYSNKTLMTDYDDAKKFIPNYIRIVLESFLSFKLALVKDEKKGRLPGLNFLINKAISELNNYDSIIKIGEIDKNGVVKRLNNLKRIADNESHGSISKIESLNYISEKELKDYCKHTLQIIKYFDEIHFNKAKALISI